MDDRHEAAQNLLKTEGGDKCHTMNFIEKCSPSQLQDVFAKCRHEIENPEEGVNPDMKGIKDFFQSAYEYLVDAFESVRSKLAEIFETVILDWKQKLMDFIIDKTVDLIEYITGFNDEEKIKAIVKCTVSYIVCVSTAIAQN